MSTLCSGELKTRHFNFYAYFRTVNGYSDVEAGLCWNHVRDSSFIQQANICKVIGSNTAWSRWNQIRLHYFNSAEKDTTSDWSANMRFSQSEFRKNSALYKFSFFTILDAILKMLSIIRQNNYFVQNSTSKTIGLGRRCPKRF